MKDSVDELGDLFVAFVEIWCDASVRYARKLIFLKIPIINDQNKKDSFRPTGSVPKETR